MSGEHSIADTLAALARREPTPQLDPDAAARMIARATEEAEAPPVGARRGPWIVAGVAAAIAAAALVALVVSPGAPAPSAPPTAGRAAPPATHLRLPSGDELAIGAGARFELGGSDDARRVELTEGHIAFDVRPLEAHEGFEVHTPHLVARVVGTVFTVDATAAGSTVRVYEGRVEVAHDGEIAIVAAGEALRAGAGPADRDDPLMELARAAAARRAARPAEAAPSAPVADGPPAPAPDAAPASDELRRAPPRVAARSVEPEDGTPAVTLALARRWLVDGQYERALAAAQDALRSSESGEWRMVEGDALRGAGRAREAVAAYERAAEGPRRVQAGYLIAQLRADRLADPTGALDALERYGASAPGSPLAERALRLRHRLLSATGRAEEAARTAAEYVARFPEGPAAEALARASGAPP
ncbi:MAG: FecR domain-containing protein [Sandaracinaceae bacterium]|nr:FecR domain-containing protein [Sandaracinaceae bacterium]